MGNLGKKKGHHQVSSDDKEESFDDHGPSSSVSQLQERLQQHESEIQESE